MLHIDFLRNMETGREIGKHYYTSGVGRVIELFSIVAQETDTSLLQIADRAATCLDYPIKGHELLAIYLGHREPWVKLDKKLVYFNMDHRPDRYSPAKGGTANPFVTERYLRNHPELYQQFRERIDNENSGKIIQTILEERTVTEADL